jgi:hypothetical protein
MRKGFFASVAALAASAGVACGQGSPAAGPGPAMGPAPAYPGYGTAAMSGPQGMPAPVPGMPTGHRQGVPLPTAGPGEMPHNGPVPQPGIYDPWAHGQNYNPEGPLPGSGSGQLHRAAGGPDRFYADVEWLLWRPKSGPIAFPLLTAGPPILDAVGNVSGGVIGQEGTRVLVGNENIQYGDPLNALRVTVGWWCTCDRDWGVEWSGFIQEQKSEIANFFAPLDAREVLARPAIDALTGSPIALIVSVPTGFPLERSGAAFFKSSLSLGGTEFNVLRSLLYCDTAKFNLLAGIRYIDHIEKLSIITRSSFPTSPDDSTPPDLLDIVDEFNVRNQFLGGQVGFQAELRRGRWFTDVITKFAVGNMNEQLNISGFTNTSVGGVDSTAFGGWFALPTNIGKSNTDEIAFVPELTLKFGYQWTQRISTYVGYNMLYISRLLRPGDQIDATINPTLVPVGGAAGPFGPPRPARIFNETDFWTQGVTWGLSIRY